MAMSERVAKFRLGQVVRHRMFPFRGVIFDVDPEFSNTEEWYQAIPEEIRPRKDQPFYHLLAENEDAVSYVAYVSEQNLVVDNSGDPIEHPQIGEVFSEDSRTAPTSATRSTPCTELRARSFVATDCAEIWRTSRGIERGGCRPRPAQP